EVHRRVAGPAEDSLTIGDVNGDGKLDVVVANGVSGSVVLNTGDGTGASPAEPPRSAARRHAWDSQWHRPAVLGPCAIRAGVVGFMRIRFVLGAVVTHPVIFHPHL